jgi:hypothetical protein
VAPPPKPKRCDGTVVLTADQTFGFNSATLTTQARKRVNADTLTETAVADIAATASLIKEA